MSGEMGEDLGPEFNEVVDFDWKREKTPKASSNLCRI